MKKLIFLSLMLMLGIAIGSAQKINGMGVFMPNNQSFISTTTDLDSITYKVDPETKAIIQQIWEKDSLYEYPISTIDSTQFETFELPEGIIIKDGIGDWSEMRITKDGLCMLQKFYEDSDVAEKILIYGKGENSEILRAEVISEKNGNPKYMVVNDFYIIVDNIYNDSLDFTIVYKDSIALSYTNIPIRTETLARSMIPMRSWSQMNEHARRAALLQGIIGVMETGVGLVTITIAVGGALPSGGATLAGIASGLTSLIGGLSDLKSAFDKLYKHTNYYNPTSEMIKDVYKTKSLYILGEYFSNSIKSGAWKSEEKMLKFDKASLGGLGLTIASIIVSMYDGMYGHVYTWNDLMKTYIDGIATIGYEKVTRNKYIVRAFVSPIIIRHPVDDYIIDCEYGIILYKDGVEQHRHRWCCDEAEELNGRLEANIFNLEPETTYEYQAYFYDYENKINVLGNKKSFTTASLAIPEIKSFEVLDATYSEEGYPYGGENYSYKYNCTMTVQMEATEGMEDYGYIYKGVDGNESFVSLKGQQFPYSDNNYVYYRKRSYSTATFCGYVKYYNDDNIYKGEWKSYVLAYGKYPTPGKMIDLGLSVKWAAYNIGADYPEETGNLYAWGEIDTKEQYTWQTYKYRYGGAVIYCNNLGNISGNSQYDAARSIWGDGWRIPQSHEVQELVLKCKKEDFVYEGVNGMLFTGPNGNSIFVPKMSYWLPLGVSANYTGQTACTWYPHTNDFMATNGGSDKYVGRPIRAVYGY